YLHRSLHGLKRWKLIATNGLAGAVPIEASLPRNRGVQGLHDREDSNRTETRLPFEIRALFPDERGEPVARAVEAHARGVLRDAEPPPDFGEALLGIVEPRFEHVAVAARQLAD